MIKDQMTLATEIDTTQFKATVNAISESDDVLLPYAVGYIPWEMIEKSSMFNWIPYSYEARTGGNPVGLFTATENPFSDVYPSTIPTKGVPFCWITTNFVQRKNSIEPCIYNGTTFEPVSAPVTEYTKTSTYSSVKNIVSQFKYSSFSGYGTSLPMADSSFKIVSIVYWYKVGGTYSDAFSIFYNTKYNPVTNTFEDITLNLRTNDGNINDVITDSDIKSIEKLKPFSKTLSVDGNEYKLYLYIVGFKNASTISSYQYTGMTLGNFIRLTNSFGSGQNASSQSSVYFKMYSNSRQNAFGFENGYSTGLYSGNSFILSNPDINIDALEYESNILHDNDGFLLYRGYTSLGFILSSLTATDIQILALLSCPVIYNSLDGKEYTQEYNENYELTGGWIEVNIAPDLNPDTNTFNPDDIPEPTPPEPEDVDTLGDDITGFDFTLTPLSAANNFTTLYALTTGQLAAFGRTLWAKLWSEDFWKSVGTTFLNDFSINPADMMRYFINLHYFPFDLSVYPWSSTDGVYVGRAVEPIAVETRVFSRNLIQIDGGVCAVPAYYNDFRDYEPCTNVEITIPFCGNVQIAPSECIGKVLSLTYTVDMQTGAITALVYINSDKKYIVAQLSGQCAATIPITADNNLEFVGRIAKVTGATLFEGIKSGAEMFKESESVKGSIGIGAAVGIASGAAAVTGLPPVSVHKMGESGGFANYGGAYRAYITVTRQKYSVPTNYGGTVGYAADFTATVGSLSGLFACQNVNTSGLTCNYDERAEIKRLLESGCYM